MKTTIILVLNVALAPLVTYADGGTVQLREAAGPFLVTVFVASEAPRVGLIDTSVLVQDRMTGRIILDPTVNLELQPIASTNPQVSVRAIHSHAKKQAPPSCRY